MNQADFIKNTAYQLGLVAIEGYRDDNEIKKPRPDKDRGQNENQPTAD